MRTRGRFESNERKEKTYTTVRNAATPGDGCAPQRGLRDVGSPKFSSFNYYSEHTQQRPRAGNNIIVLYHAGPSVCNRITWHTHVIYYIVAHP